MWYILAASRISLEGIQPKGLCEPGKVVWRNHLGGPSSLERGKCAWGEGTWRCRLNFNDIVAAVNEE